MRWTKALKLNKKSVVNCLTQGKLLNTEIKFKNFGGNLNFLSGIPYGSTANRTDKKAIQYLPNRASDYRKRMLAPHEARERISKDAIAFADFSAFFKSPT